MTPEQCAKSGTEHGLQTALMCALQLPPIRDQYPDLTTALIFAIPNGGARGDSVKSRAIRGGQLKAEGVKDGVADIFLSVARGGYFGFYIEMKVKDKKPTKNQRDFRDLVTKRGYLWAFYDGWEHARDDIIKYMQLPETMKNW
jgi:hypothetical protein